MPELPEVETVVNTLLPELEKKRIVAVQVLHPQVIGYPPSPLQFARMLCGDTYTGGWRRGKYILFSLAGEKTLICHLRMTGKLLYSHGNHEERERHTHLRLIHEDGSSLSYVDTRRFGRLYCVKQGEEDRAGNLGALGPEPLSKDWTPARMAGDLKRRRGCIKGILLDQTFVAGLGNIYVDEILFQAGLHPETPGCVLTEEEVESLHRIMKETLLTAIANRGTTFRDYRDGWNQGGENQTQLKVYGKEGAPCPRCGELLQRKKVCGRSSFFCPLCQAYDSRGWIQRMDEDGIDNSKQSG